MDVKHEMRGDMLITLDDADIDNMKARGYSTTRDGLCGSDTKTWVRNDTPTEQPHVQIDGASDVTVYLPPGAIDLPVRVEQASMDPYMDDDRGRVDFYFGESGAIVVRAANA